MFDKEYFNYKIGEDLPDIFFIDLNMFKNIYDPDVYETIRLYDILQKIKYNMSENDLLTYKYVNNSKNPDYEKLKSNKIAVCYNATFNKRKILANLQTITNLMFLDIDGFSTKQEAEAYKKYCIEKYDWIVSSNLSLSRTGLHFVIWVDEITNNEDYNRKYDLINRTYFDNKLDANAKSLTRYTIVPHDFNIYINKSPNRLNISELVNNSNSHRASKRVIITKNLDQDYSINQIESVTLNEKSIRSEKEKEEGITMTTPYTFHKSSHTKNNTPSARTVTLNFEESIAGLDFNDPNEPVYFRNGKEIIKINIFPFLRKKVVKGKRTKTICAMAMKMIYVNYQNNSNTEDQIKEALLGYIVWLNKQICNPPLPHYEVVNSFISYWTRYQSGDIDVSELTNIQRSFWSSDCTLEANQKRKISCKLYYEPIVTESKKKIADAINQMRYNEKITQKRVAKLSGLNPQTVKKYWSEYKADVKDLNDTFAIISNDFYWSR
jgi:hypothetical protein